jgi:hypothetical protein
MNLYSLPYFNRRSSMPVSKLSILDAISDKGASNIFKSIASLDSKSEILITKLNLTRKQYYSRMSVLLKAGLVKRYKGRYFLTTFGKVIYDARVTLETKIDDAISNYWKLKAIDSLEMPSGVETDKVISVLIDNEEIRSILMKQILSSSPDTSQAANQNDPIKKSLVTVPNRR